MCLCILTLSLIRFKFTTTLFAIHREHRGSPGNMLQIMMDWRVQLSTGVPTVWQQLRAHIQSQGPQESRRFQQVRDFTNVFFWISRMLGM